MPVPTTPIGRVLVTGGASGLGAAVVAAVVEAGGTPIVLDLRVDAVSEGIDAVAVDVSDTDAVEQAVRQAADRHDGLDAVVTAAGIDTPAPIDAISSGNWEKIVAVNLIGTASVVRAALPALEAAHGRVVTISSSLALRGVGDGTAYSASKFGVRGFSQALAAETAGRIGVTNVIPAGMRTNFFADRTEQYKPGPDAQLIEPEYVANAILFALSQPAGCEIRELSIMPATEPSWP
ncbi:NADP-dependent 3-hydroxy acid dehydrogenase YdfG [Curtobacterium sp. PhB25]|uniref:SDR family oxidoreductase n=1 Tax=unclassified Curtobacterium TaxID=257496 RepID=UPI00104DF1AD|nr:MULTISPECIES: SDR family oxidoreductase [unclassified Curtobacterium]TCU84303.1 NADP-dependent 3-hydroxy acid dehydrogenase YdfG [Curtobacterium sp. PhB191]TDW53072.1 NADP-dependent 3-hydroxy acid dehydrogenase YdfG [Curtobacterium sp. PhB42]TDW58158.1 NADP-dependent 3-hydroxy acid dehydrogenase YdfG [Curtobacterium sp. PhB190]TDW74470.1 NADP-dependent 3-hydroxy acid dehydrogenase YdfG [Curtobacterium sp. PhB25]